MAIPGIPQNFYLSQANGQAFTQWDITAGAVSYSVQRSIDGVTFTTIASPSVNQYLDTTVAVGTNYYYQVAAVGTTGTSPYTTAQSCVPTLGGEMSLGELQIRSRQRADRLNSNFVTTPEVNSYINQSMFELYDLLIDVYEDYFKAPNATFYSTGGTQQYYSLPDGATSFIDDSGNSFVPEPIYKLLGLDMGLNTNNNGWVTVAKYNFIDRNRFFYPTPGSTIYGVYETLYRWMGNKLELIPPPSSNLPFRILYIPRLRQLLTPQDITTTSISGWLEYVITDVAIKILQKEESDVTVLAAQKLDLRQRIINAASNRDAGRPDTISNTSGISGWGGYGGSGNSGFPGGF